MNKTLAEIPFDCDEGGWWQHCEISDCAKEHCASEDCRPHTFWRAQPHAVENEIVDKPDDAMVERVWPDWSPIADLTLEYCHGYAVSKTVLLLLSFPETNQNIIKMSRVWEENAERTLIDLKYDEYSHITHFMELPPATADAIAAMKEGA